MVGIRMRSATCEKFTFSEQQNGADLVAKEFGSTASGVRFCALSGDSLQRVKLEYRGCFLFYNALGVIACGMLLDIPLFLSVRSAVLRQGRQWQGWRSSDRWRLYDSDRDYAHTPDALKTS
jgi:UDP-N-acetylmuramoyl-L-alanyl-D-glutamate--2,6-diaminopimelate ligase